MPLSGGAGSHWAIGPARRLLDAGGHEGIGASRRVICWNEFGIRFRGLDSCVTRGQEGYSWGRLIGLLGRVCPKRRGLKPRWPGCLQETRRWPGVFVVFSLFFRCAFGVALHGARADLLRFGHLAPSMRRPDTRAGPSGGPGWGGALEGVWALSWTRACTANAGSRPITRVRASSSGTKPALKAAAPADGQNPHQFQPSLRGTPGGAQPRIPPYDS